MKPFATYCVRTEADKIPRIKEHWEHHKPLCVNGMVCLDISSFTEENIAFVKELGLEVCCGEEGENFDLNLEKLQQAAKGMESGWFLSLDSDEYIPPFHFQEIALAIREDGVEWLHGWMCDRLSEGGLIHGDPENFSYATLNATYPVMADVTKHIQGSCNSKCFLSKKPDIGLIHHRHGKSHPTWFRLDHFKWFGDCIAKTDARSKFMWTDQYKRTVQHYEKHGRFAVENCLSTMWESRHGWFDFWTLYKKAVDHCRDKPKPIFVEVGVWQGKSATFLSQYALALGVDYTIYLVDKFKGCEATAAHLPHVSKYLTKSSSFLDRVTSHFQRNNLDTRANFLQLESVKASRVFDDETVDFVFIDDDHSYDAVIAGLNAWYPKVRNGGIIAGHDYNHTSVFDAVNNFFKGEKTVVPMGGSWYVEK